MQKPEVSGRLTKWAIELGEFEIEYKPRSSIKGQAVSDFIAEFSKPTVNMRIAEADDLQSNYPWKLHVDGSSNTHGSGKNSSNHP